jgi:hypothetical protein
MGKTVLTWLKYSGWILLLGGVLSILHSCSTLFGAASTWIKGTTAQGKVVAISKQEMVSPNGQRRHLESAVVQFTTAQGMVMTVKDKVGSTSAPYKVGEKVTVAYEPTAPETALIAGSAPANTALSLFRGISGWIALGTGALLILLAKLPWVEHRPRRNNAR